MIRQEHHRDERYWCQWKACHSCPMACYGLYVEDAAKYESTHPLLWCLSVLLFMCPNGLACMNPSKPPKSWKRLHMKSKLLHVPTRAYIHAHSNPTLHGSSALRIAFHVLGE